MITRKGDKGRLAEKGNKGCPSEVIKMFYILYWMVVAVFVETHEIEHLICTFLNVNYTSTQNRLALKVDSLHRVLFVHTHINPVISVCSRPQKFT